jgi:hypothetical protein
LVNFQIERFFAIQVERIQPFQSDRIIRKVVCLKPGHERLKFLSLSDFGEIRARMSCTAPNKGLSAAIPVCAPAFFGAHFATLIQQTGSPLENRPADAKRESQSACGCWSATPTRRTGVTGPSAALVRQLEGRDKRRTIIENLTRDRKPVSLVHRPIVTEKNIELQRALRLEDEANREPERPKNNSEP